MPRMAWRRMALCLGYTLPCVPCASAGVDSGVMAQERLDPIDWATYEPYLWANETAFCRRSAVLFGALTRLSASPPQVRPA